MKLYFYVVNAETGNADIDCSTIETFTDVRRAEEYAEKLAKQYGHSSIGVFVSTQIISVWHRYKD